MQTCHLSLLGKKNMFYTTANTKRTFYFSDFFCHQEIQLLVILSCFISGKLSFFYQSYHTGTCGIQLNGFHIFNLREAGGLSMLINSLSFIQSQKSSPTTTTTTTEVCWTLACLCCCQCMCRAGHTNTEQIFGSI